MKFNPPTPNSQLNSSFYFRRSGGFNPKTDTLRPIAINGKLQNLKESLRESGYRWSEYLDAMVSIAGYSIAYALDVMHIATTQALDYIERNNLHKTLNIGREYRLLKGYDQQRRASERASFGDKDERIRIMCKLVQEDLEKNIMRMRYTAQNWYNRLHAPQANLLGYLSTAQICTITAINIIHDRVMEVRQYLPTYMRNYDALSPERQNALIVALLDKAALLTGMDNVENADIKDCKELMYGMKMIENACIDVDQMEIYCGYAIEYEKGPQHLLKFAPRSYYMLHPMEDPAYLQAKAQREADAMQAEEDERRAGLAYTTKEVETLEATEGMSIEQMFAAKGWTVTKNN